MRPRRHYPIPYHYPGTATEPATIEVECACGEWEFFSQANINGGPDAWGPDFEAHEREEAFG